MSSSPETVDARSIIGEVEDFYQEYIDSFNRGDLPTYCLCFDSKSAFLKRDVFNVLNAGPELEDHARALRKRFLDNGWVRTDILARRVWLIEPEMATIVADLGRVTHSDAEYERARCIYLVVRHEGRWRIRSTTVSIRALSASDGLLTGDQR
ncbi:MAG: hypothetical protein QM766_20975 [Burkholderiaceae bacterium]